MSNQIPVAFVKQFRSNLMHLSQQKGSRLRPNVRVESQQGESQFFDRLGSTTAVKSTVRHADTPLINSAHSRRRVTLVDYDWADLIDNQDKIRMLIDPTSEYAQAAMWALGRAMDDEIIEAAGKNAAGGVDGGTAVSLGSAQQLVASDGSATAGVNLNVASLRRAKQKLDEADVDPSIQRYAAVNASMLQSLLEETETTSSDFNTVKALVNGELDTFMGFKFIRTERLLRPNDSKYSDLGHGATITFTLATGAIGAGTGTLTNSSAHSAIFWAQDGLLLSVAQDMRARIEERADKRFSVQVYASQGIGSTRLEEEKVVLVHCKTS